MHIAARCFCAPLNSCTSLRDRDVYGGRGGQAEEDTL
jgi:hypothetical protein